MKLSKKFKQKIKKNITITLASIALFTTTLATIKLTDISMPLNINTEINSISNENQIESVIGTRLENTDTITYIYDADDLAVFRDAVNAGDNYSGKTVYLMNDIDMSTVCSSTLGSWTPIGTEETYFTGTFDGQNHKIDNIYINTSNMYKGLFRVNDGTIKNIIINSGTLKGGSYFGSIAGVNNGTIDSCGNNVNISSIGHYVGGIAGYLSGNIYRCYNAGNVTSTGRSNSTYNEASTGGIAGGAYSANIFYCYNTGAVKATYRYAGGILGIIAYRQTGKKTISYCYNTGTVSSSENAGSIVANASKYVTLNRCYYTSSNASYVGTASGYGTPTVSNVAKVASATLQTYTTVMGENYAYDVYNQNNGYPVLAWQNETPVMSLNRNQEYIKVGETLKLNVVETDEITEKIGTNYANSNFTWTSTNEDVATVDSNGIVTGVSDGYTTVYAYHEASGLYAMAVINVAKDFTNPQIETGNGFTAILKSDGTVWTIGNNSNGQLGNGTNDNSNIPVQVKIDEDTNLSNIIKISVGTDHVLALSKDGKVYAWGLNTYGQLGQNNTTSTNYAKVVFGGDGASYLSNIVDISAGAYGSIALEKNGNVYVWGNGTYGEMGNKTTTSSNLPIKTTVEHGIQVSIGGGDVGVLTSEGVVWSWGRNTHGQHGINCSTNTTYPMKTALNVTELSKGGYHTTVKKIDGTVYSVGCNSYGRIATTSTGNTTKYAKTTLPSTVTETNKVKYIKAGIINTTIQLTDGTVWETGFNLQGELGNGSKTTATSFVQGLTKDGAMENVLVVGRNTGNISGTTTTGYGLNTAVITENGDIYTTGDNSYGQIGDNTTTSVSYYTRMGFAYLDYEDKTVEIDEKGYQIDLDKLKYIYSSINAYNNEQIYTLGDIKYTSLDETIAIVNENGKITAKDGVSGITKIKIEDVTNGYEIYITAIVNKLENTNTVTYIYSAEDMANFRNSVNAGNTYAGKTVYVMADIDMSTVCSEKIGSWKPIGNETNKFEGTFDGNYHKINNFYINSSSKYQGLFGINSGIIQNLIMNSGSIKGGTFTGAIAGYNTGTINSCGNHIDVNSIGIEVGGIVGAINGNVYNCYNLGNITGTGRDNSTYNETFTGGIVGFANSGKIYNCYNQGNIKSKYRFAGGILGGLTYRATTWKYLANCYNTGTISASEREGSILANVSKYANISNCYFTSSNAYYGGIDNGNPTASKISKVTADTLKGYTTTLGKAFKTDDLNINNGYPILWWQAQSIELNKKQEYIKTGETLQLNVITSEALVKSLGTDINNSDLVWTSTNEDVATVDSNGLVTGVSDGYTTIYGYYETTGMYTMCIVNVAKGQATPQVESGEGFTAILKADGTVWTIGKNDNGELGDGTNKEKIEAVQVKIDDNTYLTNIVKISVGTNHVLALTKDGKVYAWGANTYGQLGQNNKVSSNYAKLVLGEGGSSYLDRIVDISAGSYGSIAVNQFGWVLVWGNGTYGEMGNSTTTTKLTPTKSTLNNAISVSMGSGHIIAIGQNGYAYTWGRNSYGELGIGNTSNNTMVTEILKGVVDAKASGFETVIRKVDNTVYGAGLNTNGQLANGTVSNKTSFTQMTLPTTVTDTNKLKYISTGRTSTSILLTDGTVYVSGKYGADQSSSKFEQAKTKDGNLENVLTIGRSNGETLSLDTAVINKSGRIYTIGSNTYGQIGNNTKDDSKVFTVMGYIEVMHPEKIVMNVGDTIALTGDNFAYVEKYFNVYEEDVTKVPLIADGKIIDEKIATYNEGTITAENIGKTMLVAKEMSTETLIYIPVIVVPENGLVVPDVKTGNNFTVTLKSNGTVWSFGTNTNGELGLGDNTYRNSPEQVEILENIVVEQISVGTSHIIALTQDGKVYTWGLNSNGQLGLGTTKNNNIPQQVNMPKSTEVVQVIKDTIVKVIANKNTSYAIAQSGKVYAWGEGYGKTPVQIELEQDIIDISESYLLDINGNVYSKETNARLEIVEKIKYISEGNSHTVFLSENGTAYTIGSNTFGQFGDGTNVSNTENVVAIRNENLTDVLRNIVEIEAGNGYTVVTLEDGRLIEFGSNQYGQLGTDEIDETNTARENTCVTKLLAETKEKILKIDAGSSHVAIALQNGNVYTWGLGTDGQLGNAENNNKTETQLVGKNIIEVNTNNLLLNENQTFNLEAKTTYFNLLQDIKGELSYESKDESVVKVNTQTGTVTAIAEGTTVIVIRENGTNNISVVQVRILKEGLTIEPQVQTNGSHTVTLKVNGTVWSYGNNENGELGNGTTKYSDEPVQAIFPEGTTIVQVDAGENFSVALDSEGYVWTWGANDYYQLGTSKITSTATPTKVNGLSNITKIAAGTYSVLAIDENKDVYGWGLNSNGELGIESYTNKVATPTKAKYMSGAIDIAVGKNHSIALKTTGEVYVTGLNMYGQLGNNDTSIKKVNTFTKVQNLSAVARISATDSGNIVSTVNGKVYTWGLNIYGELGQGDKVNKYEPTLVNNVENIVLVSGGKNHSILLDKTGKVYTTGSNKYGYLGNGTTEESLNYTQVPNLKNIMTISAGNTYTAIAKTDGTVWGFGDYNHGDKKLKSKTASSVPMQVGNDTFGLGVTQITIKKSETKNISSNMVYNFNLIYLNQNNVEQIKYESINEEIAKVNEYGEILGVREGFTWVKAIETDGTEHVVYVYVTDNESNYAPQVTAGKDFATILKSDGTMWTFGHNNNGELGIGSNRTKDIPEKTNVISSYKQISSGESFTIAIRNNGTVWSFGKNNYGQLGIGTTKNGVNPVQVNEITDIVQVATGKEHAIAIDSYGILYGWGSNNKGQLGLSETMVLTPTVIGYTGGTIQSIWAGENQSVIINTKGEVYGYGNILNGKLEGITNAVKVSVGNGYMLILTTDGEVYKYDGSTLTKYTELSQIVDIDANNNNIIAQTSDEKVYTWTISSTPKLEEIENIYTISAGENNNYVIKTDGTVFARGKNQYGQLGNSTRIDSLDKFTLVGDRTFTLEPENKIMYVNDIEELTEELQINEFNVFNQSVRNGEEYTWVSSEPNIVAVNNGTITAISDGTAKITVTDAVTGAEVTITRVVIPVEKDRIDSITVNNYKAEIEEEYKYYVEVETNENVGTISITTKDNTDKISIDNGATWFENGKLTTQIDITKEETEIDIIVETTNGTQIPYTLKVKKISTDISLENITVDGISATAISSTKYEVVVSEETIISEIIARANNNKAQVSINGEQFITWKSITTLQYENNLQITIPIIVKAENGDELEYSLTIYKESEALKLENLTVDGKEAIKTSETVYSITIARNLKEVEVIAKAISELVNVSINNENPQVQISTKNVEISDELTEVTIRLSTTIDGVEVYRDYTLNIYKKAESGKIDFVIVNGTVITPKLDGTYEIYLPAETQNATVKVIAQNELDYVQIVANEKQQGSSEVDVTTPNDSNEYTIIITDQELETSEEYKLYIKKPSVDASIKEITISNGDDVVIAEKSTEEENTYVAKVKTYDDYKVEVKTNNINAYVSINNDTKVKNIATKVVTKTDDYMEVEIQVESENGDVEEYVLKIYVMSSNTALEYIKVNGTQATLQSNGSYLINLETAETSVSVSAKTIDSTAEVRLENEEYDINITTKEVTIDAKETTRNIYVKAEDGTVQKYKLVISGLPDDTTLQKVTVNGIEAKYIEGQNKYEIRSESTEFNIEAIATDSLAKVALNDENQTIGTATTTVTKTNDVTLVTIEVVAQNGIDKAIYTLEIKEKSNDTSIANVTVNGKDATKTSEGNYVAEVVNKTTVATVKVEANDTYSVVYLDNETENASNITVQKAVVDRNSVYTIKVKAEDGTEEEYTLTIIKQEANTNIKELSVSYEKETITTIEDDEGNITESVTTEQKTYTPSLQEDGTYYLKIDRVEQVDVKVVLEDENAKVKIKNSAYVISENEKTIDTVTEKTEVIISVQAEDGTIKDYTLVIEKKSNDTTIKTITSNDMIKLDGYTMHVDESLNEIDLTLITNNELASIKLDTDEDYTPVEITRTISLSEDTKVETEQESGWLVNVEVQAEDGTIRKYTITILKTGNTNIDFVKVNNETIENINDTYTARVNVAETAEVEIKAENENATIQIIKISEDGENSTETVISTGTGTLLANVPLSENPQKYTIRITSAKGSSVYDYNLVLEQKSTEVGISYVKVDGITTIETESGYKITVSGKEKYPVLIKTTDEKAQIKISYEDYESNYYTGRLEENVPVTEGKIQEVTITVKSENGDEKEYKLYITRISDNTELEYVKVNGDTVANFNKANNTYKIIVNNSLTSAQLEIKTKSEKAKITIASASDTQLLTTTTSLDGAGTTKTVTVKIDAEDGTTEYYYINIVQLSATVSIDTITVNNIKATKTDETSYEVTISNKEGIAKVIATAQDELSTVEIEGGTATIAQATKTLTLNGLETIQTTIKITAEDGETYQEYNLTIYVQDSNTKLEYVKVDESEVTDYDANTKTYKITVDNTISNSTIDVKTVSDVAKITVEGTTKTNLLSQEVELKGPGKTTSVKIIVTAQDGSKEEYTLDIYQKSNDTSLNNITVNGDTAVLNEESGIYEIEITDASSIAKIIATAGANTSKVSIEGETATIKTATKTRDITGHEIIEMAITITAEDGTTQEYNLKITVLENSDKISYVKVNTGTINPEEDGITYKTFIEYNASNANIEIKAESSYANIYVTNLADLEITEQTSNDGILRFTINTPENVTTIKYKITSQTGKEKEYTIILTKISTDNSLKELYVDGTLIQVDEDGNYYTNIENPSEVTVKAIANNEYANIRIDYNTEEKHETQAKISAQELNTKVTITITSQSGVTTKYNLYIRVLLNNTQLDKVVVDGEESTQQNNKYISLVDNTKNNYEVFLMAVNDNATIELYDGENLISSGVGNLTEIVTLTEKEDGHTYKIKVTLDEDNYSEYVLEILRASNDTSLKLVEVNDVARVPTDTDEYVYEVGIPKLAETAKIRIETTNSYATIKIGDNETVGKSSTVVVDLNLEDSRTTVPVVITAVDGTTIQTYNILLIRKSNIVDLESVIVNNTKLDNINDVYTYYMSQNESIAHTEITVLGDNDATVQVDTNEGIGYLEISISFEPDTIKVEKTIKVTSEDGTVQKEYKLVIWKKTEIKGTILTQNFENKHVSKIILLKENEIIKEVETNEDGSYEIDIEEIGTYDIKVTKSGYLSYTVKNIEMTAGRVVDIGEYNLIAGDVVETGEIEIDDLVTLNDNYGVNITEENKETKSIYDLNEDGIIDTLDRNILKANYGKIAESIEWENPNAISIQTLESQIEVKENKQDFILPMECDYVVTSEYGYRTHPTTGEYKKHTGIDISGIHHTEIFAVAEGEVTFAGVQTGFGNCVEIKHIVNGETIYSFYAHLSQINVQVGDKVSQGDIIGLEGGDPDSDPNPGYSTGHHLHLEIRAASGYGNDVDPTKYINL